MKWKIKHIGNLLIRFFTIDKYYICEECHKIHKRDGREIRFDNFDDDGVHLMYHPLWYRSVSRECFDRQQEKVRRILRESIFGK